MKWSWGLELKAHGVLQDTAVAHYAQINVWDFSMDGRHLGSEIPSETVVAQMGNLLPPPTRPGMSLSRCSLDANRPCKRHVGFLTLALFLFSIHLLKITVPQPNRVLNTAVGRRTYSAIILTVPSIMKRNWQIHYNKGASVLRAMSKIIFVQDGWHNEGRKEKREGKKRRGKNIDFRNTK